MIRTLLGATAFATLVAINPTLAAPSVEPATQGFLDALAAGGGPPIYTLSPADARNVLAGAQAGKGTKLPADIKDMTIPAGPTGQIRLRIVRPAGISGALPVVLYFHGGGWVLGDKNTHDRLIRELARGARAAIVFVDYDRSPEAQYPVPIEEAYAATKYVADHAAQFGVDPSRLAVAGDSVGGNMAAAVTLMAKDRAGPAIRFQVLFYPVTDARFDNGSYTTFEKGPWLTKPAMQWFWNAYLPDEAKRKEPTASPLRASLDQLRGLPAALVITDENDVLRDEGEAYAAKLAQAGVRVTQTRYLGTIHDFVMLNALAETPATRAAITQANTMLRAAVAK
ncbi:MAG TPA: alpha/beta hydrolase [Stellaceae bacterium]|nr:alpha/beta hydrolase [Stellaceae bacterium]